MAKFDLAKALAGDPVVLCNGQKAYVRHHEKTLDTSHPLMGYRLVEGVGDPLSWTEDGRFLGDAEKSGSDILGIWVEPLVFEHWDLLNEGIKYLAKDEDGSWYGYSVKPTKKKGEWKASLYDGCYSVEVLKMSLFPVCDWENSLMERPEK